MKALLYTRVSHEEQKLYGVSLDDQITSLRRYCTEHNLEIKNEYSDEGISAKDIKHRHAFKRMLEDAESGDIILFTRLDRFSRKIYDALKVMDELAQKNISMKAIYEDDLDTTTGEGRFRIQLKLALAELELSKTSERIRRVMAYKRSIGEVTHGNLMLGYKVENKRAVIDNDNAYKVIWLFDKYIDVRGINTVKKLFNQEFNLSFTETGIRGMLTNENYLGNNTYPPIITEELFNKAKEIRESNYVRNSKGDNKYIFSTLCTCGYCGRRMSAKTHRVKRVKATSRTDFARYICGGNRGANSKSCFGISEDKLEKLLLAKLEYELSRTHIEGDYHKGDINTSSEIEARQNKIKRLKTLYVEGLIEHDDMMSQINIINKEILNLESLNQETKQLHLDTDALSLYQTFDKEQKAIFWRTIVKDIIITREGIKLIYC